MAPSTHPEPVALPHADRRVAALRAWRPSLRMAVAGAALAIVVGMAVVIANLVADRLRDLAVDAALEHAESVVRTNLDPSLAADALSPGAARDPQIDEELELLVQGGEMSRVVIWSPDGRIVYSSDPGLRGARFEVDGDLRAALAGTSAAEYGTEAEDEGSSLQTTPVPAPFLELYVPIRGMTDGNPVGVYEVYQDARPIQAAVDEARTVVLLTALAAAAALFVVLWLSFAGASRLLDRQNRLLRERAVRDPLTGLANHGFLLEQLGRHLSHRDAAGQVALIDIDAFRLLNAGHGHRAGDEALHAVSGALAAAARSDQLFGRFGPDEFLLADFSHGGERLLATLDGLRARLQEIELRFDGTEALPVSVSIGVARAPLDGTRPLELLSVAEAALREAKTSGGAVTKVADQSTIGSLAAQNTIFGVFEGLVATVDAKDHYTRAHSEDVTAHALFLAQAVGLGEEERRLLRLAGLLHDIGKVGVPDGILRKPGPLTEDEFEIVKQHVALGDAIVGAVPQLSDVRHSVRHHHERWDGGGYLDGSGARAHRARRRKPARPDAGDDLREGDAGAGGARGACGRPPAGPGTIRGGPGGRTVPAATAPPGPGGRGLSAAATPAAARESGTLRHVTRRTTRARALAASAALALMILSACTTASETGLVFQLAELNESGVTGSAVLYDLGDGSTRVVVEVDPAGHPEMPAHIHPGTCAELVPQPLHPLETVIDGESVTVVRASLDDLLAGGLAINLHVSAADMGTYAACVNLVAAE
jgi:diguanylate cyclase (GGDEF)-like protein